MAGRLPGARDDRRVLAQPARRRRVDPPLQRRGAARRRRGARPAARSATTSGAARRSTTSSMFDAEFFGFSPHEAAIMDPQHRQFLEVRLGGARGRRARARALRRRDRRLRRLRHGQLLLLQPAARTRDLDRGVGHVPAAPHRQRQGLPRRRASRYMLDLQGAERQRPDRLLDLARRHPPRRARACSPASATWRSPAA